MKNYRYVHYIARFEKKVMSGVVDVQRNIDPVEVHDQIQLSVCEKWGLSPLHKKDIIVERMNCLE